MPRPTAPVDWDPMTGDWVYARAPRKTAKASRPKCGARCRTGAPCRAVAVWDRPNDRPRNGRCRMHGGLSTGAKTPEGKARIEAGKRAGRLSRARHGLMRAEQGETK